MTCALRALTLCDGTQLEDPDRGLTSCLCNELRRQEWAENELGGREVRAELERLIDRAAAAPPLPL